MADEKTAPEGQDSKSSDDAGDVESRLAKLEKLYEESAKELESEKKASSSKDRRIAELQNEKKELQEAKLSKDELLKLREEELSRQKAEWERERETEKQELERLKKEHMKNEVLTKLEDFPKALYDRIRGDTPEDVEKDARLLMKTFLAERDKISNALKVGSKPKVGDTKAVNIPAASDYLQMTREERRKWADNASPEQIEAMERAIDDQS